MLKEVEGSGRGEKGDRHTKSFRDKKYGIGDREI